MPLMLLTVNRLFHTKQRRASFIYFDPPYITQGNKLYKNYFLENDHWNLSEVIKKIYTPWIITYNNHELVHDMYSENVILPFDINYSAGPSRAGEELMIFSSSVHPNQIHKY